MADFVWFFIIKEALIIQLKYQSVLEVLSLRFESMLQSTIFSNAWTLSWVEPGTKPFQ